MAILKTTPTLAVLAVLGGCDFLREPTFLEFVEERVAVHSLLVAGDDTAAVLITRTEPGGAGALFYRDTEPVIGATVQLVEGADTLDLGPVGVGPGACLSDPRFGGPPQEDLEAGCYAASVPGGVRAGHVYELLVTLPGGAAVHGSTTVPEAPVLRLPAAGTEMEASSESSRLHPDLATSVAWTTHRADRRLELTLGMPGPGCQAMLRQEDEDFGLPALDMTGRDSTVVWVYRVECFPSPVPDTADTPDEVIRLDARLTLTAFDSAYTRYARENLRESTRIGDAAVGITGAIGVFGGAASATVPVVVVVDDP